MRGDPRRSETHQRPAAGRARTFQLDGVHYEAFNTSAGWARSAETLDGEGATLNYKTIRYPGHRDLMAFLVNELRHERAARTCSRIILERRFPITLQDVVVIFCTVTGWQKGRYVQITEAKQDLPAVPLRRAKTSCQRDSGHDRGGRDVRGARLCTSPGRLPEDGLRAARRGGSTMSSCEPLRRGSTTSRRPGITRLERADHDDSNSPGSARSWRPLNMSGALATKVRRGQLLDAFAGSPRPCPSATH